MEKVSLFLIVAGLVIIAVVLLMRWRLRNAENESPAPSPIQHRAAYEEPEYDPLFALDKKAAAQREADEWDVVRIEPKAISGTQVETGETLPSISAPPPAEATRPKPQPAPLPRQRAAPRVATDPERVITLNVMAPQGQRFAGGAIAAAAQLAGLELGMWSIYHCYAVEAPNAPPLFSVANMVKPGSFDAERMHDISTVGLSLFMVPAGDENDLRALDIMLAKARQLASDLGGEVRDARRSVLTRQAIERLREQLNEWRARSRMKDASG